MRKEIEKVLEVMKADYYKWCNRNGDEFTGPCTEYNNSLKVTEGPRYYKIISRGTTVAGFVVKAGHTNYK